MNDRTVQWYLLRNELQTLVNFINLWLCLNSRSRVQDVWLAVYHFVRQER